MIIRTRFFLATIALTLVQIHSIASAASFAPNHTLLSPSVFGIAAEATEVPALRTLKTATFRLANGQYATVANGSSLFTHDEQGNLVPVDDTGDRNEDSITFSRLPDDVRITFDAHHPSYVFHQGAHFFRLSFPGATDAIFDGQNNVSYRIADNARLTFTVRGSTVQKAITIDGPIDPAVLRFKITQDSGLVQHSTPQQITLSTPDGNVLFRTTPLVLLTVSGDVIPRPVTLQSLDDGTYTYAYDPHGLPSPYIIDPSAETNDATTLQGVAWTINGTTATIDVPDTWFNIGQLDATGFGFDIPAAASINGVKFDVTESSIVGGTDVFLVKSGAVFGTEGYYNLGWGSQTFGNDSYLWGAALTPSDINESSFGLRISGYSEGPAGTLTISGIQMTVYYTPPPSVTISFADETSPQESATCGDGMAGTGEGQTVTATITYSEDMVDEEVTSADVTVTNGTKGTFTKISETVYTLGITSSSSNTLIMVDVPANGAHSVATGQYNTASATFYIRWGNYSKLCLVECSVITLPAGYRAIDQTTGEPLTTFAFGSTTGVRVEKTINHSRVADFTVSGAWGNINCQLSLFAQEENLQELVAKSLAHFADDYYVTGGTYILYVPKIESHTTLRVCSGRQELGCTIDDNWSFTANEAGTITPKEGFDTTGITVAVAGGYWKVSGLTGTSAQGEGGSGGGSSSSVPFFPLWSIPVIGVIGWYVLRREGWIQA
ncbi:MAG: hypothetical protein PHZ00_05040 [Candidatus Peribacteraceae bacterium]|nr:hypothetical protein [Candidatus Peribacteraceae bacterium]